jgi:starvation-inducible DNA-binding protein
MLKELREDNIQLAARMREAHRLCDEHDDVASASLLETWIDEAGARAVPLRGQPAGRLRHLVDSICGAEAPWPQIGLGR